MTKFKDEKPNKKMTETVALDRKPKGKFKILGGSQADDWNMRLANLVGAAMPGQSNRDAAIEANKAVWEGMIDFAPADPIEGILIAQLMAANEASPCMYRRGWEQPPEFFEARTKYLQLADKAARTVLMLTERLDHHRGRGQQQITVKHVTTNNVTADQAIIADSVITGAARNVAPAALLAAGSEMPMQILDEIRHPDPVGVGGGTKSK
jgi:hypothetical protein